VVVPAMSSVHRKDILEGDIFTEQVGVDKIIELYRGFLWLDIAVFAEYYKVRKE
jgi:hypothetical protein